MAGERPDVRWPQGYRIRQARKRCGYTLDDVRRLVGLKSRSYIWELETGLKKPSVGVLVKLSKALDIPYSELLDDI